MLLMLSGLVLLVATGANDPQPHRIGEIYVEGNTKTKNSVVLKHVSLYPGQIFTPSTLRDAEARLRKCGRFNMNRRQGLRPTITVIERDDGFNATLQDILVQVQEKVN